MMEALDGNQELIGQGLANIVGSFFQSYVVSGSFSRSAVAARVGARSGFYAIISALGVLLVMLFFTQYLYHLPQPVLAAIVMSAVFSLIDVKSMLHAWNVRPADGVIGMVTFVGAAAICLGGAVATSVYNRPARLNAVGLDIMVGVAVAWIDAAMLGAIPATIALALPETLFAAILLSIVAAKAVHLGHVRSPAISAARAAISCSRPISPTRCAE